MPFCRRKCGYCDFYSSSDSTWLPHYLSQVGRELDFYRPFLETYRFNTLYFGGGTPSLLEPGDLEDFFRLLERKGFFRSMEEITLEVNPESFDPSKARFYRDLGINRLSMGIQSFQNPVLQTLGRLADSRRNQAAVQILGRFFSNYSLDLIYGIPGQNLKAELEVFMSLKPPHLSAYCLTLAEGTALFEKSARLQLPEEELNNQFFLIHESLKKNGYDHYEISNYARNRKVSRHNLHYWRREHYLGLGAGASGYLGEKRYTNQELEEYLLCIKDGRRPVASEETLEEKDRMIETLLLGLRLEEGIDLSFLSLSPQLMDKIEEFIREGLLAITSSRLIPTLKGWTLLDYLLKSFYRLL